MRGGGILGVIVLVWLLIGVVAAYQRDYFDTAANSCGTAGTIALTVRLPVRSTTPVSTRRSRIASMPQPSQ